FTCSFNFDHYEWSRKREEQSATEGVRKLGSFLDGERSVYSVTAAAFVKGTALASTDVEAVTLVGNIPGSVGDMIEKA
ncbi:MAG TPA: hypothetical protein VJB65_03845, partial [Patescibacteria group bacterium]|nr:hypothetical protein [Patescibacteria group bacterium]